MNASTRAGARAAPAAMHALIRTNARLWAGEAEIFATYFTSPLRTAASDAAWLARQCCKEMVDGVVGRLTRITRPQLSFVDTHAAAAAALADDLVRVELKHYIAFAIAYRCALQEAAGAPVDTAHIGADWPENTELQSLRAQQRRAFGVLGERAAAFTEGGYCTLYRAGLALAGRSARDDAIASACAQVMADEWEHMIVGIAGLAEVPLEPADWACLEQLTLAQGRCRLRMRNAQFGYPLSTARIAALAAGAAAPLAFDYTRAGLCEEQE